MIVRHNIISFHYHILPEKHGRVLRLFRFSYRDAWDRDMRYILFSRRRFLYCRLTPPSEYRHTWISFLQAEIIESFSRHCWCFPSRAVTPFITGWWDFLKAFHSMLSWNILFSSSSLRWHLLMLFRRYLFYIAALRLHGSHSLPSFITALHTYFIAVDGLLLFLPTIHIYLPFLLLFLVLLFITFLLSFRLSSLPFPIHI